VNYGKLLDYQVVKDLGKREPKLYELLDIVVSGNITTFEKDAAKYN